MAPLPGGGGGPARNDPDRLCYDHLMAKRAIAVVEEPDMKASTLASKEAMARRMTLAGHIRDRMAKPATAEEQRLWQELKAEVDKGRLTFRS